MYGVLPYLALAVGFASTVVGVLARRGMDIFGRSTILLGFLSMSIGAALVYFRPPAPPQLLIGERFGQEGWRGAVPTGAKLVLTTTCMYVFSSEPMEEGGLIPKSERHLDIMFRDIGWHHEFTSFDMEKGYYVASELWGQERRDSLGQTNISFDERVEAELQYRYLEFFKTFLRDWSKNGRGVAMGPIIPEDLPSDMPRIFLDIRFPEHVFRRDNVCSGQIEAWTQQT